MFHSMYGGCLLKKKLTVVVTILILGLAFAPSLSADSPPSFKTIYVDDDADPSWYDAIHVKTVQEGINNASAGDAVYVYSGIYYENVEVNKSINLMGEAKETTIIDGNEMGDVFRLKSSFISIRQITIQNCSSDGWSRGIINSFNTTNMRNISIAECILMNNGGSAICLTNVSHVSFINNHIHNNSGNALRIIDSSDNITIYNCSMYNNGEKLDNDWFRDGGISINGYEYVCSTVSITNCLIHDNIGNGITIGKSRNVEISNNAIYKNLLFGIALNCLENAEVYHNNISQCGSNGILISDAREVNINENVVKENGQGEVINGGILIQSFSKFITIKNNVITKNIIFGIRILHASNVKILENNLIDNHQNAYFSQLRFFSIDWYNNFWDKPKFFPHPIFGRIGIFGFIPWLNFDRHPAQEPYVIP